MYRGTFGIESEHYDLIKFDYNNKCWEDLELLIAMTIENYFKKKEGDDK